MSDIPDPGASSRRRLGEEPKPRVLFSWEGPAAGRVAAVLDLHAPTVRVIDDLLGIRQDDYDILVTNRLTKMLPTRGARLEGAEPHLFVVSIAPAHADKTSSGGYADLCGHLGDEYGIRWHTGYLSKAVDPADELLPVAAELVSDDLVPTALSRKSHTYFDRSHRPWQSGPPPEISYGVTAPAQAPGARRRLPEDAFVLRPFLRTAGRNPEILAGWYKRGERSEGWVLPSDLRRPGDWVAAAIRHWALTYRRFPLVGGWWEDPRWQTLTETAAKETETRLKQELADITARLHEEIAAATADLEEAQRQSAGGHRRLLTDKGESLKEATVEAFEQLGYRVIDRDQEQPPDAGGKMEDLGVVDPDDGTFDPIVEVKGYDAGAKAGDFGKMLRHLVRAKAVGRSPTAIWWVVNHWRRTRAPAERGPVLVGEESFIGEHANEDVPLVLIDTTTLFSVIRAVEGGTLTPAHVRASLRAARGRWEIDLLLGGRATGDSA